MASRGLPSGPGQLQALTLAAGVLGKGMEEVIEDVTKHIEQMADVTQAVWSGAIQKFSQVTAVDAAEAMGLPRHPLLVDCSTAQWKFWSCGRVSLQ